MKIDTVMVALVGTAFVVFGIVFDIELLVMLGVLVLSCAALAAMAGHLRELDRQERERIRRMIERERDS